MTENCNDSKSRRPSSSLIDFSKEELLQKLREYRKANMDLLEDKRHLLLRSQEAFNVEVQLERTQNEVLELKRRLHDLERDHATKCDDATTQTIKELVRQLSNNSKQAMEDSDATNTCAKTVATTFSNMDGHITEANFEESKDANLAKLHRSKCQCSAALKLEEVMRINHLWQRDYNALLEKYNRVSSSLQHCERQLRVAGYDQFRSSRRMSDTLAGGSCLRSLSPTPQPMACNNRDVTDRPLPTADDIEALKYQLILYKQDFETEKEEKERLSANFNRLQLELQRSFAMIDGLNCETRAVTEKLRRVSSEKQHIISELRRLSSTSVLPFSPVAPVGARSFASELSRTRSEDVIPHSARMPCRSTTPPELWSTRMPDDFFYGGDVVRDGHRCGNERSRTPPNLLPDLDQDTVRDVDTGPDNSGESALRSDK